MGREKKEKFDTGFAQTLVSSMHHGGVPSLSRERFDGPQSLKPKKFSAIMETLGGCLARQTGVSEDPGRRQSWMQV